MKSSVRPRKKKGRVSANSIKINTDSLEKAILYSVIFFPAREKYSFAYRVLTKLSEDLFYDPANKELYSAIMSVHSKHFEISEELVVNELQLDEYSINPDFLTECDKKSSGSRFYDIDKLICGIDDLINLTNKRRLASLLDSIKLDISGEASFNDIYNNIASGLSILESKKYNLLEVPGVYKDSDLWLKEKEVARGGDIISTGFKNIDRIIDGFLPGALYALGSRPGVGKTSLGLNFFYNIANSGHGAMFISLEMSKDDIYFRLFSRQLGISIEELKVRIRSLKNKYADDFAEKMLNEETRLMLTNEFSQYLDKNAYIYEGGVSSLYSNNIANIMRYYAKTKDVKVFIIDCLQLIKDSYGETRNLQIENITSTIKGVARDFGVSAVILSQLSRVTVRGGARPALASLRDSGAIEQDADVVMLLYRDVDENSNKLSDITELEIAKNRFGISDRVTLYFDGTKTTFYEQSYDPFLE